VSIIDRIGIRRVAVERTTVISEQSFETVLARLTAAVGHPDMSAFAQDVAGARASADLERIVNAAIGPAGLMEMARFDIGDVLSKGNSPEERSPCHRQPSDHERNGQTCAGCGVVCAGDGAD
jgi:hypothetical protein